MPAYGVSITCCPYTPDFVITLKSGEQKYIEVKPILKLLKEDVRKRFEVKIKSAKDLGIELLFVTSDGAFISYFALLS